MNNIINKISEKTGYPVEVVSVVAAKAKVSDEKQLENIIKDALADRSIDAFKLKDIAETLNLDHEKVLKAAVNCGAMLSKDEAGEFWVVGKGLINLVDSLNGVKNIPDIKVSETIKEKIQEVKEDNIMPETKSEIKETKQENKVKTERSAKSGSKNTKTVLKSMISGSSDMDVAKARKFLVQSKLRKLEEVAYMSDTEVSKIVNKDYTFLTIGNGTDSVNIAIPKEELKKIDITNIISF